MSVEEGEQHHEVVGKISQEALGKFSIGFSFCEGELIKPLWEPGPLTGKQISAQG